MKWMKNVFNQLSNNPAKNNRRWSEWNVKHGPAFDVSIKRWHIHLIWRDDIAGRSWRHRSCNVVLRCARERERETVFANSFLHLNWPYLLISKSKSIDFDSGGWASCCVIAGPHAVYCEQDSRCAPVIATYPSDYCQWMLLGVFWLGLQRLQGSLNGLHGNMQSASASLRTPPVLKCNAAAAATSAALHPRT